MALLTVVQARTASFRLPGKVLLKIGGMTILEHVLHRLSMCDSDLGTVIVATGSRGRDNEISDVCAGIDMPCFRGAEHDVLHRFHMAAGQYGADLVLRVTADCPLLDPALIDQLIRGQRGDITRIAGAPKGLGEEELITRGALTRMWNEAVNEDDREHVSTFADGNPHFKITYLDAPDWLFDHRELRLVLDTPDDWERLRDLYGVSHGHLFEMTSQEIIDTLELAEHPA